ncbi:MAG: pitrilysin family protein [Burkholderiaceae bacterium]
MNLTRVRCAALRGVLLVALSGFAAAAAGQANSFATPPQPGAPRPLAIAAPVEQRLPNGLRVVLAERPGVQLVTAQLLVLSGSETDPTDRAGLAALTAALLPQGTTSHSASALASAAESLGGTLEASAGWHQSTLAITVAVPFLDAALGLVSEAVRRPRFAAAEFDRQRRQALDELKVAYANPATLAALASQHLLFGSGAYGHPSSGTPASLARIRRAEIVAMHAANYRPDNAVLILSGDIDTIGALRLARRHFGDWTAATPSPGAAPLREAGKALPQQVAIIDMAQSGQSAVVLAAPVPPLAGPERAVAAVLNAVLGGAYSSRLNQEIRIRRGLSYSAGSRLEPRPLGGLLQVVVQTKNESATEVLALVQHELDRLVDEPIDAAELSARKATLIGDFGRSVETTAGLGAAVRSLIVAGLPPDELRTRIDALVDVNADEVRTFAATVLGEAGRRAVVAGDASRFQDALKAARPSVTVIPVGSLDLESGVGIGAP